MALIYFFLDKGLGRKQNWTQSTALLGALKQN